MSSVTFSSGVHVGTRNDAAAFITWFAASPTTEFSPVTLALSGVQVLTSAEGRVGDSEPVLLRFEGSGLTSAYDALKAIDSRDVVGGAPRTTLGGFKDAVARSGRLMQISLRLYGDSAARTEWGILSGVRNSVAGGERGWSVSAVWQPCDALGLIAGAWYLSPTAYAELSA